MSRPHSFTPLASAFLLVALLGGVAVLAAPETQTVYDDTNSAWTYTPADAWGAMSADHLCDECNTKPDPAKTHGKTWHDLSKGGSAQLSFLGSSLAVFAVCPLDIYRGNFTFLLDNEPVGSYMEKVGGCADYVYNQSIFHISGLDLVPHIFQVNNWIAPGADYSTSNLVLDYAVVGTAAGHAGAGGPSISSASSTMPSGAAATPGPSTGSGGKTTTIDDADPAWKYTGPWGAISAANPCTQCISQPDPTKVHGSTWHDLSQAGTAQLSFSGTELSVYAVCPGPLTGGGAFSSNFALTLDGKSVGVFTGPADGCKDYQYNQVVYKSPKLEQGTHNFTISNVMVDQGNTSDLLLDYAVIVGGTAIGAGNGGNPSASAPKPSSTKPPGDNSALARHSSVSSAVVAAIAVVFVMMV